MTAPPVPSWHELYRRLPEELREYQVELEWSRERLWALALPAEELPVDELSWQLELPWWRDGERYFVVRPIDVLAQPHRYAEHCARVLAADLRHPIQVTPRRGRKVILDGLHRLVKSLSLGRETLRAQTVPADVLARIAASTDAQSAEEMSWKSSKRSKATPRACR